LKKKILIIGFGSIGKRHAYILSKFKVVNKIIILTKQKSCSYTKIKSLQEIKLINPDYILICSNTSDHYKHLNFIEKNFKNKLILVEKPLFNKNRNLKIKNNKVIVGYHLRYHPIIKLLKKIIKNKKIFSVYVFCGSYLPNWRKGRNYKYSYSSSKKYGGGALLDLSHEIDYTQWIFGKINKIDFAKVKKISNLKIKSDDCVNLIGKINKVNFSINLNYFSIFPKREIYVDGKNFSLQADLINNSIKYFQNGKIKNIKLDVDKNFPYQMQHSSILNGNFKTSSSYKNAKGIMFLIDKIRNQNK